MPTSKVLSEAVGAGFISGNSTGTILGNTVSFSDSTQIGTASSLGMRNRIINGDMRIDQRNAGAAVTISSDGFSNRGFPVDRFTVQKSGACSLTAQRTTNGVSDFVNSIRVTVSTADSSVTGTDYAIIQTRIEGYNIADMLFGSASAKTITLSFWVRSSVTGPYYVCIANYSDNRSYPARYTINSANTWEFKTITLTADTSGTWYNDNSGGLNIAWTIGSASFGTANTWQGLVNSGSDQTQLISTLNATFDLTGVQLEVGSVATPFERRLYTTELQLCQRYYVYVTGGGHWVTTSTNFVGAMTALPVPMRATPTVTRVSDTSISSMNTPYAQYASQTSFQAIAQATGATNCSFITNYKAEIEL